MSKNRRSYGVKNLRSGRESLEATWTPRALSYLALVLALLSLLASTAAFAESRHVIVKYRDEGPHALEACAERLSRERRPFAPATRDRGRELDTLQERFGRLDHRSVFRAARGQGFRAEARALRDRLKASRARVGAVGRGRARRMRPACDADCEAALPELAHVYRVALPGDLDDPADLIAALRAAPQVEYAHLDYDVELDQLAPPFDDPFLASSGSWDQPYADLWGLDRIGAREAWDTTTGQGVLVAVVDTGLDYRHPDIAANVWVNPGEDLDGNGIAEPHEANGIDDDGNGFVDDQVGFDFGDSIDANEDGDYDDPEDLRDSDPFDERGHGTHVAGTIAAVAGNGEGIVGVAPGVRLMGVKGFPNEGSGVDSVLWRAVLYAAENGADVINNSWSCSTPCPRNDLARDVLSHVEALGTVVVTSAGNATTDVVHRSPENLDAVLTVGSVGFDERISSFSNRGYGLDVVAPGGGPSTPREVDIPRRNILSLLTSAGRPEDERFFVGEGYWRLAGTSMAAPHVAGAVAMLRSLYPDASPEALREQVRLSSRDLARPGHDEWVGPGALHLPTLLATAPPDVEIEIEAPVSGARLDPADGPFLIFVRAIGADPVSLELAWAEALRPRDFTPLEALDDFDLRLTGSIKQLWQWAPSPTASGPRMLRIRVALRDGRVVERFRTFAVEPIDPRPLTLGERNVAAPITDGRRAVWRMDVDDEIPSEQGIAVARVAPRPRKEALLEEPAPILVEGRPQSIGLDGQLLAWSRQQGNGLGIAWCRLGRRGGTNTPPSCDERTIDRGAAFVSRPFVGNRWIVWQADEGGLSTIEGCRVDRRNLECAPVTLSVLDPRGPRWRLRSFDGRSLFFESLGEMALCVLPEAGGTCTMQPITRSAQTPASQESRHDGDLIALNASRVDIVPTLGCLPDELFPGCEIELGIVRQLFACRIEATEDGSLGCDAVPISERPRVQDSGGIAISGNRLIWSDGSALEDPALYTCEFDAETGMCPRERIGGALARQSEPSLRGNQLVWRGARDAGRAIWSMALPAWSGTDRPARAKAGFFFHPLRVSPGDANSLAFESEVVESEGASLLLGSTRIFDPGPVGGHVWLFGRTVKDRSGHFEVLVRARTEDGLSTSRTVRVDVVGTSPRPGIVGGRRPNAGGRTPGRAGPGPRR
ncbi:MAG: S8 family serine peptidase [Myxococcota bacterium]